MDYYEEQLMQEERELMIRRIRFLERQVKVGQETNFDLRKKMWYYRAEASDKSFWQLVKHIIFFWRE